MAKMDVYEELKNHFASVKDVDLPGKTGAQGLKYNKKMFAMFLKGDLLLKLSPSKIDELISEGVGLPYDPGTGKIMKDRVLIPFSQKSKWIALCIESKEFVKT